MHISVYVFFPIDVSHRYTYFHVDIVENIIVSIVFDCINFFHKIGAFITICCAQLLPSILAKGINGS
jgi:hypothetical protein